LNAAKHLLIMRMTMKEYRQSYAPRIAASVHRVNLLKAFVSAYNLHYQHSIAAFSSKTPLGVRRRLWSSLKRNMGIQHSHHHKRRSSIVAAAALTSNTAAAATGNATAAAASGVGGGGGDKQPQLKTLSRSIFAFLIALRNCNTHFNLRSTDAALRMPSAQSLEFEEDAVARCALTDPTEQLRARDFKLLFKDAAASLLNRKKQLTAARMLELFDTNASSTVSLSELDTVLSSVVTESEAVRSALDDAAGVMCHMGKLVSVLVAIIMAFVGMFLVNADVEKLVFSTSSLLVAFAFVFGNTAAGMFKSCTYDVSLCVGCAFALLLSVTCFVSQHTLTHTTQ
jgi:hypothetical protein